MTRNLLALPARLWRDYGSKLIRFAGVSVVNVSTGQTLLYICYARHV